MSPSGQLPQEPPQPFGPQDFLEPLAFKHVAWQSQFPVVPLQSVPAGQIPQVQPQPSSPQALPTQVGVQSWQLLNAALHLP